MTRLAAVSVLIALALAGCQSPGASLTLQPVDDRRPFVADFTRACWSPALTGQDQVVLLDDPIDHPSSHSPGDPLRPVVSLPISHMLVIQIQWRSSSTPRGNLPAANNALLNWYVRGKDLASIIHYSGSAYVSIDSHGDSATVTIGHGSLKLADKTGPLQDPFGAFTVDGSVDAVKNPARLQQALKDLAAAQARMLSSRMR